MDGPGRTGSPGAAGNAPAPDRMPCLPSPSRASGRGGGPVPSGHRRAGGPDAVAGGRPGGCTSGFPRSAACRRDHRGVGSRGSSGGGVGRVAAGVRNGQRPKRIPACGIADPCRPDHRGFGRRGGDRRPADRVGDAGGGDAPGRRCLERRGHATAPGARANRNGRPASRNGPVLRDSHGPGGGPGRRNALRRVLRARRRNRRHRHRGRRAGRPGGRKGRRPGDAGPDAAGVGAGGRGSRRWCCYGASRRPVDPGTGCPPGPRDACDRAGAGVPGADAARPGRGCGTSCRHPPERRPTGPPSRTPWRLPWRSCRAARTARRWTR